MVTPMHGRARYALRSRLPRLTWLRLQGVPLFAIAEGPGPDHGQPSAGHSVQHLQDLVPAALVCCPRLRLPPRFFMDKRVVRTQAASESSSPSGSSSWLRQRRRACRRHGSGRCRRQQQSPCLKPCSHMRCVRQITGRWMLAIRPDSFNWHSCEGRMNITETGPARLYHVRHSRKLRVPWLLPPLALIDVVARCRVTDSDLGSGACKTPCVRVRRQLQMR